MGGRRRGWWMAASLATALIAAAPDAPGTRTWDFARDEPGRPPRGFTVIDGAWRVVEVDGRRAVEQTASNVDEVYNMILAEGPALADVDLSVRLTPVSGEIDQGGGLVWRAKDAKNYYLARWNPLEDNVRVYKVVGGVRRMLKSVKLAVPPGAHDLRVVTIGMRIRCSLDGRELMSLDDGTFSAAGKVGLWTKADARTRFEGLRVAPAAE